MQKHGAKPTDIAPPPSHPPSRKTAVLNPTICYGTTATPASISSGSLFDLTAHAWRSVQPAAVSSLTRLLTGHQRTPPAPMTSKPWAHTQPRASVSQPLKRRTTHTLAEGSMACQQPKKHGACNQPTKRPIKAVALPLDTAQKPSKRKKHQALLEYNKLYCGLKTAKSEPLKGKEHRSHKLSMMYFVLHDVATMSVLVQPTSKHGLPTRSQLHHRGFDRPYINYSFTVEASFDTCMFPILKSCYLAYLHRVCRTRCNHTSHMPPGPHDSYVS